MTHILPTLPPCTSSHGWILEAPLLRVWRKGLHNLPEPGYDFWPQPTPAPDCLHIFVDGSCDCPTEPDTRLATWAVSTAHLPSDSHYLIARGIVPGIIQTSARAELWATVIAFRYGLVRRIPFCIWTDYENAYRRIKAFQRGETPGDDWNDSDLWKRIYESVRKAMSRGHLIQVTKIVSHLDGRLLTHEVEQWARRGNQFVDAQAEEARADLPGDLTTLRHQLRQQTQWLDRLRNQLHTTMIKVGAKATKAPERKYEAPEPDGSAQPAPPEEWAYEALRDPTRELACTLHPDEDILIKTWLVGLNEPGASPRWLSWQQLLIDYQITMHSVGPWKRAGKGKNWNSGQEWKSSLRDYCFQKAAKWFGEYIQFHARTLGQAFRYKVRAPDSRCYARWAACVLLPLHPSRWATLEDRLKQSVGVIKNSTRDLQEVPPMA